MAAGHGDPEPDPANPWALSRESRSRLSYPDTTYRPGAEA